VIILNYLRNTELTNTFIILSFVWSWRTLMAVIYYQSYCRNIFEFTGNFIAWFQASVAAWTRSSLFLGFTQLLFSVSCGSFGKTPIGHVWPLKMVLISCPKTSLTANLYYLISPKHEDLIWLHSRVVAGILEIERN